MGWDEGKAFLRTVALTFRVFDRRYEERPLRRMRLNARYDELGSPAAFSRVSHTVAVKVQRRVPFIAASLASGESRRFGNAHGQPHTNAIRLQQGQKALHFQYASIRPSAKLSWIFNGHGQTICLGAYATESLRPCPGRQPLRRCSGRRARLYSLLTVRTVRPFLAKYLVSCVLNDFAVL